MPALALIIEELERQASAGRIEFELNRYPPAVARISGSIDIASLAVAIEMGLGVPSYLPIYGTVPTAAE